MTIQRKIKLILTCEENNNNKIMILRKTNNWLNVSLRSKLQEQLPEA